MAGIILKHDAAPGGANKMVIQTSEPSGGHLRLFPGTNQTVFTSIATQGTVAADYGMFKSFDSGETFVLQPSDFPNIASSAAELNMAVSFNNRYYFVGDPSTIDASAYIAVSNNGGSTWEWKMPAPTVTRRYVSVSASRDGKYAIACNGSYNGNGDAILTQDFGETWTTPVSPNKFIKTFVSPDGQNMLIGAFTSGQTKYSDDYGNNWSTFSETLSSMGGAMVSGDGNYKVVYEQYQSSGGAKCYVSTDWINWTLNSLSVRLIGGSISNDGKYMLIASTDGYNSAEPYVNLSTDYGQTWSQIAITPGNVLWNGTAMSSDGKYMIVIPGANADGYAYKSVDYGQSWMKEENIPYGHYNTVKMSKSGRYTYITGSLQGILVSNDYMASWAQQYDPSTGIGVFINF